MFSLAMGPNFHVVYPCQPQQCLFLCTPHCLIYCMPLWSTVWQNPIILSSMHQIFTQMYSFTQDHHTWRVLWDFPKPIPFKWCFPTFHYKTIFLLPTHFSSLELSKLWKNKIIFSPLGNDHRLPDLNSDLLFIRPSVYIWIN